MLERPTLIAVDYHNSYALPTGEINQQEFKSTPVSPAAVQRAKLPILEMKPWEWLKPVNLEIGGVQQDSSTTWRYFLRDLEVGTELTRQALVMIGKHYQDQLSALLSHRVFLDHQLQKALYDNDYARLIGSWIHINSEQDGLERLTKSVPNHKVVVVSSLYFEMEPALKEKFSETGEWQQLVNTEPQTIPAGIVRAGLYNHMALPMNTRINGFETRYNHLGAPMAYPLGADYKFLTYILLARIATNLGMDFIAIEDDPEIILPLIQAGVKIHTSTSMSEYREYFRTSRSTDFEVLFMEIARYDGFSSGLGKLAGVDIPSKDAAF